MGWALMRMNIVWCRGISPLHCGNVTFFREDVPAILHTQPPVGKIAC
jgi:hypothetical protein